MPGFMGLRGLEIKSFLDMQKERRKQDRGDTMHTYHDQERRAMEKVQEILSEQENNMATHSGDTGGMPLGECEIICAKKVTEFMSDRVAVLSFDDTLLTVQGIFSSVKFRHLPIVDDAGCIIGIISDRDILRIISPFYGTINEQTRDIEIMNRKVGMVMTRNPLCARTSATVLDAVRTMNSKKISCLPVLEEGTNKLQGIVTWKDIVRAFCPHAFTAAESGSLRAGVHINPESRESVRLRAKASESARTRAESGSHQAPAPPGSPQSGRFADSTVRTQAPSANKPSGRSSETKRISLSPDRYNINPSLPDIGRPTIPGPHSPKASTSQSVKPPPAPKKVQEEDYWG